MTEGTNIGLFVVLAVVIFGILIVIVYSFVRPNTTKTLNGFKDGAVNVLQKEETNPGRPLGLEK